MALQSFTVSIGALKDVNNNDKNYVSGEAIYVKTIGGTFAPIFRDLAGTSEIAQDGLANQTNVEGQFTFFVEAGDYILEYQNQSTPVTIAGADYFNNRVEETVNQIIIDTSTSRGFRVVGDFASGFTYELPNDVAVDASGNYWAYADVNALPVVITAGTTPSSPTYTQVTFNQASGVTTTAGINAQQFIDNFELKIFQSPTDNLTKVSTFAGGVGVVYEVRKTSDNSLATIYSDKDGVTSIPQNGTANVSNGDAECVFYIDDGSYIITINAENIKIEVGSYSSISNFNYLSEALTHSGGDKLTYKINYYDSDKVQNSASEFAFTGNTTPAKAGTTEFENGLIYNSIGREYAINNDKLNAAMFGVKETDTANLKDFVTYCWSNSKVPHINAGSYSVSEQIANVTVPCLASLVCENGVAELTYSGSDLDRLFFAEQADNVLFNNITINASDLVAAPIDIRKTVGVGGVCAVLNTKTVNSKQVGAIGTNPSGILISGEYSVVDIINSNVENVTYVDPARSSTGIGVIQFTGKANIINSAVSNILTPSGVDADGIKVFGKEFSAGVAPTTGKALIQGCKLHDCQGRAVKMQIRDWEAADNTVSLSDGFETITEWRGFDGQDGGGNVHSNNYEFGSSIVFGSAAKLVQFSSSRDDGISKVSRFEKNEVDSKTNGLSLIAGINLSYGEHVIVIDENVYRGATISRGVQFRAQEGVANIDSVVIKCRDNDFVDLTNQDLFLPFDAVDFGDKLFLEFTGNDVQNKASLARFYNSLAGFSVGNNFKINNNVAVTDRVDWPFDMDQLPGGNSFSFAGQSISNIASGVGTFGYIVTDGVVQRVFKNDMSTESRRVDGGVWVTV